MKAFAKLTPLHMYRHNMVSYVIVDILLLTMGGPHHVHHQYPLFYFIRYQNNRKIVEIINLNKKMYSYMNVVQN